MNQGALAGVQQINFHAALAIARDRDCYIQPRIARA
jgi:hypothetical protein